MTASGLGVGTICAPDASWSQVSLRQEPTGGGGGPNEVTQEVFGSVRPGASAESFRFSFYSGACGSTPVAPAATAVAVRYTGVYPYDPVDGSVVGANTNATLTAPALTATI